LVFVLTAGGAGGKTLFPGLFAYNEGFKYGKFGYAAAVGNVMVIVIAPFLFVYLRGQARGREGGPKSSHGPSRTWHCWVTWSSSASRCCSCCRRRSSRRRNCSPASCRSSRDTSTGPTSATRSRRRTWHRRPGTAFMWQR